MFCTGNAEKQVGAGPDLLKKILAPSCFKKFGPGSLRKEMDKKQFKSPEVKKTNGLEDSGFEIV